MLIRKQIINPAPEREVVVVRPRQPTGLYAMLGLGTFCALGLAAYLAWSVPNADQTDYGTTAVIVRDSDSARAQRLAPKPAPTPPTVIINQPPVIQTPPPVIVKQPERTVIVEGSSEPERTTPKPLPGEKTAGDEDVDATIKGN